MINGGNGTVSSTSPCRSPFAGGVRPDRLHIVYVYGSHESGAPDLAKLEARLGDLTGVRYSIRSAYPAGSGYSNSTLLIDADPQPFVIKVQTSPSYVHSRDPAFEPKVLAALGPTATRVPALLGRDAGSDLFGSPWFAMTMVDGVGLPDEQLTGYAEVGWYVDADADERASIWNGFIDQLATLHNLPADTFGPDARGGSHSRMLEYWTASLDDVVPSGGAPVQQRALDWLQANAPRDADSDPKPCKGDARMANLLTRRGEVVALIDWELAHIGDPRGDIAHHLYLDGRYASITGRRLVGLPDADATWNRWEERTGLVATDRHYWEVYAAITVAIIATRAMHLGYGFDINEIEGGNPFVPDIEALLGKRER